MAEDIKNKKEPFNPFRTEKVVMGPASPVKRILAFMIDIVIIFWIFLIPFSKLITDNFPQKELLSFKNTALNENLMLIMFFVGIVVILYFVLFEVQISQTPGKIMLGLYVFSTDIEHKEFKKAGILQILVRNLGFVILFPFLLLIDSSFVFFNNNNQRLLEIFSRTIVVERHEL